MIRIIDLRGQITGDKEFSLYDNVTDRFMEFHGSQKWANESALFKAFCWDKFMKTRTTSLFGQWQEEMKKDSQWIRIQNLIPSKFK